METTGQGRGVSQEAIYSKTAIQDNAKKLSIKLMSMHISREKFVELYATSFDRHLGNEHYGESRKHQIREVCQDFMKRCKVVMKSSHTSEMQKRFSLDSIARDSLGKVILLVSEEYE